MSNDAAHQAGLLSGLTLTIRRWWSADPKVKQMQKAMAMVCLEYWSGVCLLHAS